MYSDNVIITVHDRPAICTHIGWIETTHLCLFSNKISWPHNPPNSFCGKSGKGVTENILTKEMLLGKFRKTLAGKDRKII